MLHICIVAYAITCEKCISKENIAIFRFILGSFGSEYKSFAWTVDFSWYPPWHLYDLYDMWCSRWCHQFMDHTWRLSWRWRNCLNHGQWCTHRVPDLLLWHHCYDVSGLTCTGISDLLNFFIRCLKLWDFSLHNVQKINLNQVRFNPCDVRLNWTINYSENLHINLRSIDGCKQLNGIEEHL